MKKIVFIIAALLFVAGNAFAAFPVINWSSPAIYGTDPQEAGIGLNYNISSLSGLFMGGGLTGNLALKTDVFGIATFTPEDPNGGIDASYSWALDLDGDLHSDIIAVLSKSYYTGVVTFTINGVDIDAGTGNYWQMSGNNVQVIIPSSYWGSIDPDKFGIYASLDGAGGSPDDRLPDAGWSRVVPEPASAAMLGMGLIGLFGSVIRRKFMA